MKTTKILLGALRVSALVAVVLAFATSAQAQIVNVDLLASTGYTNLGTYSGLGAASDPGTYWNAIRNPYGTPSFTSSSTLLESDGVTSTGVSFTLTSPVGLFDIDKDTGLPSSETSFANPLLAQWDDADATGANPATFKIAGLSNTAGVTYNLFLYAQNGPTNSSVSAFTIGSTTLTATNTGGDTSGFVNNGNYVEFTGLTANGLGDISGTWYSNGSNGLNGFQIQEEVAAVPEPSSLATMSLAGIAMLLFFKRFKKQSV